MTGGTRDQTGAYVAEAPCVPWANIAEIQKDPDRLCPRFELSEENATLGELALSAVRIGTDNPLWHRLFDLHTSELAPKDRRQVLYKVMHALSDEGVAARIKQQQAKEAAKAAPKRKRKR